MNESEQLGQEQSDSSQRDLSSVGIELGSSGRERWTIEGALPPKTLRELGEEAGVKSPALVNIEITKENKLWRVQGDLEVSVELPCSRCLAEYRLTLMVTVNRFFSTGEDPAQSFGQTEMEEDVVFLEAGRFSPLRFAEEEFILVLPMIPICDVECSGLCQNCGANKNREPCNCPTEEKENPFSILGKMKVASDSS